MLPQWWSDQIQTTWNRTREAAVGDWRVQGDHSIAIDASIIEAALAFGHGARCAFPHWRSWDRVCPQLRSDWDRLGHVGPAAWDRVVEVIRHEWLRAAGPEGDAAPDPDAHRAASE
jgi:hypothetical protein